MREPQVYDPRELDQHFKELLNQTLHITPKKACMDLDPFDGVLIGRSGSAFDFLTNGRVHRIFMFEIVNFTI